MSAMPKPEECWEEAGKKSKKKGRTILWLGILFTAVTLGTVSNFFTKHILQCKSNKNCKVFKKNTYLTRYCMLTFITFVVIYNWHF